MNTVPPHLVGRASALNNVIRQIASAFGIAVFTTVFQTRQVFHFSNLAYSANLNSQEYLLMVDKLQGVATNLGLGYGEFQGISTGMVTSQMAKQSMVYAMGDCFLAATAICLVGLGLAFFLKTTKVAADNKLKDLGA